MPISKSQLFLDIAFNSPKAIKNQTGFQTIRGVTTGSIVRFNYSFAKEDRNPVVLIVRNNGPYYEGLNLHYIRAQPLMQLISPTGKNACGNKLFNWAADIKPNQYINKSYRKYKKIGVTNLQVLNCDFLRRIIAASAKLNIQDLTALRTNIEQQINQEVNTNVSNFLNR
jgi:hypothetical protein